MDGEALAVSRASSRWVWASRVAAEHGWLRQRAAKLIGRGLRRAADPTDLAHAAFAAALARPPQRKPANRNELRAWLRRVLARIAARAGRRRGPDSIGASALASLGDGGHSPDAALSTRERDEQLAAALSRLPPRQRLAIQLRLWERLSFADVAARMNTNEGNARVAFHRAIESLQRMTTRELE
jgi:RNA polymerase sigma-70 factor, ECF subfamily